MADIQPKNTDTIRVNVIKEKTASAGITLDNTVKVDTITEKTGGSRTSFAGGVKTDTILEATSTVGVAIQAVLRILAGASNVLKPLVSTLDIGTTTLAEHIANLYVKNILSNGADMKIGPSSAHELQLQSDGSVRMKFTKSGTLHYLQRRIDHTGFTSGGEITETTRANTTVSTSPVLLAQFDVAANSQMVIRMDLVSRDASTGNVSYIEQVFTCSRAGGSVTAAAVPAAYHTTGTALHTPTLNAGASTIQVNIQNASGTNTTYGLAFFRVIPLSTSS